MQIIILFVNFYNLMSNSLRLPTKQAIKNSKNIIKPPYLNNFQLMSSQDNQQIDHLNNNESHIEQKTFFESEEEEPEPIDIKQFLGSIKYKSTIEQNQKESAYSLTKKTNQVSKSPRIQDQKIIEVPEVDQQLENFISDESEILEQIEFNNDEHQNFQKKEKSQENYQQNPIKLFITYMGGKNQQAQNDYYSSSTPNDLEISSYRVNNRNSKNTCQDDQIPDSPLSKCNSNKSCIAKPMRAAFFEDEFLLPKKEQKNSVNQDIEKQLTIRKILNKWEADILPQLQKQQKGNHPSIFVNSSQYITEANVKYCVSQYEKSQLDNSSLKYQQNQNNGQKKDKICLDCQNNKQIYQKNIRQISLNLNLQKSKNQTLQRQKQKNQSNIENQLIKIAKLEAIIKQKQLQIQLKNSKIEEINQEQDIIEQKLKKMTKNLQDYEKVLNAKNLNQKKHIQKIKQLELQKFKLHSSPPRNIEEAQSPTFHYQSLCHRQSPQIQLHRFPSFGSQEYMPKNHQFCNKQIQQLQEQIFDLEQKIAGVDMIVEERTRNISQVIEKQIKKKCSEQYQNSILAMKQQNNRLRQTNKILIFKKSQLQQQLLKKEQELIQKSQSLRQTYDGGSNIYIPENNSPRKQSPFNKYEKQLSQFHNKKYPNYREQKVSFISSNLGSPKQKLMQNNHNSIYFSSKDLGMINNSPKRRSPKFQFSSYQIPFHQNSYPHLGDQSLIKDKNILIDDRSQLLAINNKIQRLRKEIHMQLDGIH